jgi:hypothetical protein
MTPAAPPDKTAPAITALSLTNKTFTFSGRIGRKALAPGAYKMTLTGVDPAGTKSKALELRFTIVRR